MQKVTIVDSSCLILLSKISELDLLRQTFGTVFITAEIRAEFQLGIPSWINVVEHKNTAQYDVLRKMVDDGEASALALALVTPRSQLILDDLKARKIAKELDVHIIGTLAVIVLAKKKGVIGSVKPILDKLLNTNFRISKTLIDQVLLEAGEQ